MATTGLLMVFTGNGKGKTTAALGMALRAAGHGLPVCVIQFIKGRRTGELEAIGHLPGVEIYVMGRGLTRRSDNIEEDRRLALEGWEFAKERIESGKYALVILDELTYLLRYGLLELAPCLEALARRGPERHVLVTGRYAPEGLIAAADLVTEMRAVKHPLERGVRAQAGIEF